MSFHQPQTAQTCRAKRVFPGPQGCIFRIGEDLPAGIQCGGSGLRRKLILDLPVPQFAQCQPRPIKLSINLLCSVQEGSKPHQPCKRPCSIRKECGQPEMGCGPALAPPESPSHPLTAMPHGMWSFRDLACCIRQVSSITSSVTQAASTGEALREAAWPPSAFHYFSKGPISGIVVPS